MSGRGTERVKLQLPRMGRLRSRLGVAVDGDFTSGRVGFKAPGRSLGEVGQMSLEIWEVVQPGTIHGESCSA